MYSHTSTEFSAERPRNAPRWDITKNDPLKVAALLQGLFIPAESYGLGRVYGLLSRPTCCLQRCREHTRRQSEVKKRRRSGQDPSLRARTAKNRHNTGFVSVHHGPSPVRPSWTHDHFAHSWTRSHWSILSATSSHPGSTINIWVLPGKTVCSASP